MRGPTLPVAVLVGLDLVKVGVLAYGDRRVVHAFSFTTGRAARQRLKTRMVKGFLTAFAIVQIGPFLKRGTSVNHLWESQIDSNIK